MASNHLPPPTGLESHRFPGRALAFRRNGILRPPTSATPRRCSVVGNGYLGMRANPEEGRDAHTHGTYVNGFHETWEIQHAENAFGFAKVGQTIVNVPDAKLIKLYVDDEPLLLSTADLEQLRTVDRLPVGVSRPRSAVADTWRQAGSSPFDAHGLDGRAPPRRDDVRGHAARRLVRPVVISSQLLNRQDGQDEYHVRDAALGEGRAEYDPRKLSLFEHRVLRPTSQHDHTARGRGEVILGYTCANSGMTLACGYRHEIETGSRIEAITEVAPDLAKTVIEVHAEPNIPIALTKYVSYHTSTGVPCEELVDRCSRTLHRASETGVDVLRGEQATALERFWESADIEIEGDDDRPAGDPMEPVPARPSVDQDPGAGHRREGRHRRRLRRTLLLGHRGLRRAVPGIHRPDRCAEAAALPVAHARRRPSPRARHEPGRRALRRGARSTARKRRRTTRPARRSTTSTPTWRSRSRATSTRPATSISWPTRAPRSWSKPLASGTISASTRSTTVARSTSIG